MAKLMITTQVYENYGAHDWDGEGSCPQYWKAKGGEDYVVKNFEGGDAEGAEAVKALRSKIESNDMAFYEVIVDWCIKSDDYLTEFERSQLDYEGIIRFRPKELVLA